MFSVTVTTGPSGIHGTGLFAAEPIARGALVYTPEPAKDRIVSPAELATLPRAEQASIRHYGYFDKNTHQWHCAHDAIRFCNHARPGNLTAHSDGTLHATRAIAVGEELTHDYAEFEELRAELR